MKQSIITIALALLAFSGSVKANEIKGADLSAEQGTDAVITINYAFDADNYTAFQFDLLLPEGIETIKDNRGRPTYVLGDCISDGFTMNASHISSSGADRFVCFSMDKYPIEDLSGVLLQIPIHIADTVTAGNYAAELKDMFLTTTDVVQHDLDDSTFSIEVTAVAPVVPAAPTFTPSPGTYYKVVNISIVSETEGAEIHVTFHGETPTEDSFLLTKGLTLTESYTVKAVAIKDGVSSEVVTGEYIITDEPIVGDYKKVYAEDMPLKDGKYLIVCEDVTFDQASGVNMLRGASVLNPAFNGNNSPKLDATSNYVKVTRSGDTISASDDDDFYFTITLIDEDDDLYTIQAANGTYIGREANTNGIHESDEDAYENNIIIDDDGNADIVGSGGAYLRYNSTSGQDRFRYFKSSTYSAQKPVQLYYQETTGVESIIEKAEVVVTTYYNLQGVRVNNPAAGQIYIRVATLSDGSVRTSKVVVK